MSRTATIAVWVLTGALAGSGVNAQSLTEAPTRTDCGQPADESTSLVLPTPDLDLQRGLDDALSTRPFARLVTRNRLSVSLVDLSDPCHVRYSGVHHDVMRYAASLPKIAILLTVFAQIDQGVLDYTPELRGRLERMIRRSSNRESTNLIRLVGFEAIARVLRDPRYELYDEDRQGGLWVGKDYGGGLGRWRRDPLHNVSHGATTRQVARFFVMLNRGELITPWASAEMKDILSKPQIAHKFVRGLLERPGSILYRKSGTWQQFHADAALVERDGTTYVAVALLESAEADGVLSRLIVRLDDLILAAR